MTCLRKSGCEANARLAGSKSQLAVTPKRNNDNNTNTNNNNINNNINNNNNNNKALYNSNKLSIFSFIRLGNYDLTK